MKRILMFLLVALAAAPVAMVFAGPVGAGQDTAVPASGFTLPPGFTATLFADGLATPRHIAVAANGDVYVTLRSGQAKFRATDEPGGVAALRDTDGDGLADRRETFGTPDIDTGLALRDGYLYYSSMTTVYASRPGDDLVPSAPAEVVAADMPQSASGHRSKALTVDGNGNLYVQVGAPSNSCQPQGPPGTPGLMPCTQLDEHGGVFRFSATARNQVHAEAGTRYSTGHRNIVALEWNDAAGALYGVMHGRDGLSQAWPDHYTAQEDIEQPAEEFHRIDPGSNLGWPYTYYDPIRGERMVMPEYGGDGETPAESGPYQDPLIGFPAHWAPDDLIFYTGTAFPARYRNGAFIAFHGPVAPRGPDPGYGVVFVPMNADGEMTGGWETFADDFEGVGGRPAGLALGPDGSLFIVDDAGGRIWKVRYTGD